MLNSVRLVGLPLLVACLMPLSAYAQDAPSWRFYNNKMPAPNCSAYYGANLTGADEPWTFGYVKTHPPSAPQAFDLTVVTLQHRSLRLSRIPLDDVLQAWIDGTPIRLQVLSYSVSRPDPFSTGYLTLTVVDERKWYALLLSGQSLVIDVPNIERVKIPIGQGQSELRKVDACDLRPRRGD